LYTLLLGNVQEDLQEKKSLIIVPDGILNFLPFETLVDEQGEYLIENYQIGYAQSLAVLKLITERQHTSVRKSLLAFGGAVYNEQTYNVEMIDNEKQLAYLQKQVDEAVSRGSPLGSVYASLGFSWSNLPGTLDEVKRMKKVAPDAEIMTGKQVKETTIKEMSAEGRLGDYKIIHFATHGIAVPEIPELSALVLSQVWGEGEEDGYLNINEVINLKMKADFVNLSACQTGLGKLYNGEGVVGLTQAFLIAGANGLSVSLWSVADESTAQFMVTLYSLVENEGLTYLEAMSEVKRRFIAGDFGEAWKAPYFWAPFVYYGK
jgi:CHAT domain-containing protein